MRHRERTTGFDLRLELGHHRTVGGEHVAETDRDQPHGALASIASAREVIVERLAIHLSQALGSAKHGHRLDRFVGRDHHHGTRAGCDRGISHVDRAEDVGLDRFAPVPLQERHMLERCCVEYDVRPEIAHQAEHAVAIAHIGKAAFDLHACLFGRKRFQDGMQRGFRILHHQHARCAKSHNAVADFGAY